MQNTFVLAIYTRLLTEEEKSQTTLPEDVDPDTVPVTQSAIFESRQALDEFLIDPELDMLDIKLLSQFKVNEQGHIVG